MARQEAGPILNGIPSQLPDTDPEETQEWLESLDGVIDASGRTRARYVMLKLLERAREMQVGVPSLTATDYINTISPEQEPWFPGDEDVERRVPPLAALERRDHGPPRPAAGRRRRRPHLDLRVRRDALRGRDEPLLPRPGPPGRRRPGVLPGPRLPRHVRPGLPRGPAQRGPVSTASARRRATSSTARSRRCRPTRTRG